MATSDPDLFELEPFQLRLIRPDSPLVLAYPDGRVVNGTVVEVEMLGSDVDSRFHGPRTVYAGMVLRIEVDGGEIIDVDPEYLDGLRVYLALPKLAPPPPAPAPTAAQRVLKPALTATIWLARSLGMLGRDRRG